MDRSEKIARLKKMVRQVAPEATIESLLEARPPARDPAFEGEGAAVNAEEGLRKLSADQETNVTDAELFGLEAIVMPRERPVAFVRNDRYEPLSEPWTHLNGEAYHARLDRLLPSIGRVELPTNPRLSYGGTGFVVGPDLLMTNRHVARLFAEGLGERDLMFTPESAAVDFKREEGSSQSALLQVRAVVMVHPYWDMAILRVEGLGERHPALALSVRTPKELVVCDIAAVGYPARDDRNDLAIQDRIFGRKYNVKRFQPGKLRARARIRSFENVVNAMTHDSSTLGGNSGSAVLDVERGEVVGLHFAGEYLKANYAVPAFELARDARVVDAGVRFAGRVPATDEWDAAWRRVERVEPPDHPLPPAPAPPPAGTTARWTISINIDVSLGEPVVAPAGR
jgi:endonuclease G